MLAFTDTKLLDTALAFNCILALSQASITTEPVGATVGVAPTPTVTVFIRVQFVPASNAVTVYVVVANGLAVTDAPVNEFKPPFVDDCVHVYTNVFNCGTDISVTVKVTWVTPGAAPQISDWLTVAVIVSGSTTSTETKVRGLSQNGAANVNSDT
jgi:hypothetical protein